MSTCYGAQLLRQRIDQLLGKLTQDPEHKVGRAKRAIEVLEWIRTPQARKSLEGAAASGNESVAREAKAALARLAKLPTPP